jgi:hypothetical protein
MNNSIVSLSFDRKYYVVLGKIPEDANLEDIILDLRYLYPFRIFSEKENVTFENIEDFLYFRKKYKLLEDIIISKKFYGRKSFHKPVIYRYSGKKVHSDFLTPFPVKRTCILAPYVNPVLRGKLVDLAISYGFSLYVPTGENQDENSIDTSTLYTRYLLCRGIPITSIIKVPKEKGEFSVLEALERVDDEVIYIACSSEDIGDIRASIRLWKKNKLINDTRFRFICV